MRVLQGYHTAFSDPTLNSRGSRFMDLGRGGGQAVGCFENHAMPLCRTPAGEKRDKYIHT